MPVRTLVLALVAVFLDQVNGGRAAALRLTVEQCLADEAFERERATLEERLLWFAQHPGRGNPLSGVRLSNKGSMPESRFLKVRCLSVERHRCV